MAFFVLRKKSFLVKTLRYLFPSYAFPRLISAGFSILWRREKYMLFNKKTDLYITDDNSIFALETLISKCQSSLQTIVKNKASDSAQKLVICIIGEVFIISEIDKDYLLKSGSHQKHKRYLKKRSAQQKNRPKLRS